ncbi:MAG: hypothetical protein WCR66_08170 [Bacteroidota bacterium]
MKILITVITIITGIVLNTCPVEAQHIPDSLFAEKIRNNYPDCIDTKNDLLPPAKKLEELRLWSEGIKDVTGVSGFSSLKILVLNMNKISILPNLPPSLIELDVSFNEDLRALPQLPVSLKKLDIQHTIINELPANLPSQLEYLKCTHTQIKILPKLPNSLKDLYIQETEITSLSQLPDKLETLIYNDKYIHCIPCKNTQLMVIEAGINKVITPVFCNAEDQLIIKIQTDQGIPKIKKCISGNCINGIGTLETENSEGHLVFTGSFKNEQFNGNGSLILKDKFKYTGTFKDGNIEGKGIFASFEYGFVYTGAFKNGRREGVGTLVFKDEKKSTGIWKDDKFWSGIGLLNLGEKESYFGEVKENLPDGQGIRSYANGEKFTGTFSKGNPVNGNGYFLSLQEKGSYHGDLKNGQPDGYGEMAEFDGWLYKGMWANGKRNGQGDYYNNGKLFYSGLWTNGAHEKDPNKATEKPLPKVYFFKDWGFSDNHKGPYEEATQPVNEFYRASAGLTAVIYLDKDLYPDKYWDDVKLHYIFVVYADAYDSKDEKKVGTYTVIAEPRQRKIWKSLPLGDLDGQKFTVKVYKGNFTIYESVNPSGRPLAEGKVNRTQN